MSTFAPPETFEWSPPTLKRLVMTCSACPSQWDGWNASGTYFYIRYRHAVLTVEMAHSPEGYMEGRSVLVYRLEHGDEFAGCMTTEEMLGLTGIGWSG